jgi:hypothetical protein
MADELMRSRLSDRILRLSHDKLVALEQFLSQLESPRAQRVTQPSPLSPRHPEALLARDWPHAPVHHISEHGTFLVTAGTLGKEHHFAGVQRLDVLEAKLLELAEQYGWH